MDVDDGLARAENQTVTAIMGRLKSMIQDVTAPAMTRDEVLTTIERRLTAGKALNEYMGQILARLKGMTGVDIGNVDDGLYLVEAKIKAGAEAQTENAYMHRIMGRVKAKVGALLLNQREKITDVCQALDAVQAEYAIVKDQSLRNAGLAAERENMISDVIGELRLILGTPKTEDLTLAKIMDLLKARVSEGHEYHKRLCEAVHVLTTTPMDRVVDETVRALGARDYFVRTRLSRLCPDVDMDGKTTDEVLAMIEAEQKTLTERLGTSYAREMTLVKELAETKTQLATAGKESADLARALHLSEDKINTQHNAHAETMAQIRTALGVGKTATSNYIVETIENGIGTIGGLTRFRDDMRTVLGEKNATAKYMVDTVDEMRRDMASIKSALGYPFATTREVLTQIGTQIKDLDRVRDAIGLRESAPIDYVVQRIADTRRDMLWAQGTVSMVSVALSGNQTAERTEIMARLKGTLKAQERFATLSNGLCDDLDMPTGDMDAVRRRVRDLVVFEQDVIKTMGGSDRDQVRDGIGVLQSEYKAQAETFTILRQILGLGVGCALTTIVAKVQYLIETGHMHAQGEFAPLDAAENKIALMPMPAPTPALRELVLTLHTTKTMDANEAMTAAADKIKDMRQALSDLLSTWS